MMNFYRYLILTLSVLVVQMADAQSCAPIEDDIFTTAQITVKAGDAMSVTGVQGQVRLTNVNTRQVVTSSDFQGSSVAVQLLRGAYQVDVEGVVTGLQLDGQTHIRQFRCQSDYVEFIGDDTTVTLNIIFLD